MIYNDIYIYIYTYISYNFSISKIKGKMNNHCLTSMKDCLITRTNNDKQSAPIGYYIGEVRDGGHRPYQNTTEYL